MINLYLLLEQGFNGFLQAYGKDFKMIVSSLQVMKIVYRPFIRFFTTRPLAVPDVFDSGRNVGALRPGRRVHFR